MAKKGATKITDHILIRPAVDLIDAARRQAVRQSNSVMVFTYFHLESLIVEHEQDGRTKAAYGEEPIKQLRKSSVKSSAMVFLKETWNR